MPHKLQRKDPINTKYWHIVLALSNLEANNTCLMCFNRFIIYMKYRTKQYKPCLFMGK